VTFELSFTNIPLGNGTLVSGSIMLIRGRYDGAVLLHHDRVFGGIASVNNRCIATTRRRVERADR
jgi:hypothetical protein